MESNIIDAFGYRYEGRAYSRAIILVAEKMDYKYVLVALYFIDNTGTPTFSGQVTMYTVRPLTVLVRLDGTRTSVLVVNVVSCREYSYTYPYSY